MNLIPFPYRILAMVLMIFAVVGAAYKQGVTHESDRRDALELKQTKAAIVEANAESTRRETVGAQREVAREQIRVEYRTIKEKADESIKTNPAGYDCVMDSNGLRLWNAANAGTAAPVSGEPDHRLLDAAIGEIGASGRAAAEPHRGDGALHAVPGPAEEVGGVHESSPIGKP